MRGCYLFYLLLCLIALYLGPARAQDRDCPAPFTSPVPANITKPFVQDSVLYILFSNAATNDDGTRGYTLLKDYVENTAKTGTVDLYTVKEDSLPLDLTRYTQIWTYDMKSDLLYPFARTAIANWYKSKIRDIVIDARFSSSVKLTLTPPGTPIRPHTIVLANYYENLRLRGGGLVIGTNNQVNPSSSGVNDLLAAIGMAPITTGTTSAPANSVVTVDGRSPLIVYPTRSSFTTTKTVSDQLYDDMGNGRTPIGLQKNQQVLYLVAGDVDKIVAEISSTIRGSVGFLVDIQGVTCGQGINSGSSVTLSASLQGGKAPYTYSWSDSLDGVLTSSTETISIPTPNSKSTDGRHVVTVTVTDSTGAKARSTMRYNRGNTAQCAAGTLKCPPLDIVFLIDTSASMKDEGFALCDVIDDVLADIAKDGIIVSSKTIYGITRTTLQGATCIKNSIYPYFGQTPKVGNSKCAFPSSSGGAGNGQETWGEGTAIIAERFPWNAGSARVIVPISDEGPCDGNPVDSQDISSIDNAIQFALKQNCLVSPILGTDNYGDGEYAKVRTQMERIANATKGIVIKSVGTETSTAQMSANLANIIRSACTSIPPPCDDNNKCTIKDRCENGICVADPRPCPQNTICDRADGVCKQCLLSSDCDDDDKCTTDTCVNGKCTVSQKKDCGKLKCDYRDGVCKECTETSECNDNNKCTTDVCTGGKCVFTQRSCPGALCDVKDGVCKQCIDNTNCNDKLMCTTDTCNLSTGTCSYVNKTCPSGQQCDSSDGACKTCLNDAQCDDKKFCTVDKCDPAKGVCSHTPKDCGKQKCDSKDGSCKDCLVTLDCPAPDLCTIPSCSAGKCVFTPKACPINQACNKTNGICANTNRPPVALCKDVTTPEDTPIVIQLNSTDPDIGQKLKTTISRWGKVGTLYQYSPLTRTAGKDLAVCTGTKTTLNFTNFRINDLLPGALPAATWVIQNNGASVVRSDNGEPSVLLFPTFLSGIYQASGDLAATGSDDDWMGIIFGYQSNSDYFLFDWKQAVQGAGTQGIEIKRIFAQPKSSGEVSNPPATVGTTIFQDQTVTRDDKLVYTFFLVVDTLSGTFALDIYRKDTNALVFTKTIVNPVFNAAVGYFGPYAFSEPQATFSRFSLCTGNGAAITTNNVVVTDPSFRVVWVPNMNVNGKFQPFDWIVNDGFLNSNLCPQTIVVTPVNDPPIAIGAIYTTPESTPVTVVFSGTDVENSPLIITVLTAAKKGGLFQCVLSNNVCTKGAAIPADGVVTDKQGKAVYVPNAGVTGNAVETFHFRVNDGQLDSNIATVVVNVKGLKAPEPTLNKLVTREDTPLPIQLTANAGESATDLGFTVLTLPPAYSGKLKTGQIGGTLTDVVLVNGQANIPSGELVFVPALNYNDIVAAQLGGSAFFVYRAYDKIKASNSRTVPISVIPVNDPPVAIAPAAFNTKEETPVLIELLGKDVDNDNLQVCLETLPQNGTVYQVNGDATNRTSFKQGAAITTSVSTVPGGACFVVSTTLHNKGSTDTRGFIYYVPKKDLFGSPLDKFRFSVADASARSNIELIQINVQNVNDPPVAVNATPRITAEDTPIVITLSARDPDNTDAQLTYIIDTPCKTGTFFQVDAAGNKGTAIQPDGKGAVVTVTNPQHKFLFAPLANENGNPYCTFSFYVQDPSNERSNQLFVPLIVTAVNDPPVATPTLIQTKQNVPASVALRGTDIDSPVLTSWITVMPAKGKLYQYSASATNKKGAQIVGATVASPVRVTDANGQVVFEPTTDEYGTGNQKGVTDYYTEFQFLVKDEALSSGSVVVPVGVTQTIFKGPTPTLKNIATPEDTVKCFQLTATPDDSHPVSAYKLLSLIPAYAGSFSLTSNGAPITAADVANGLNIPGGNLCLLPAKDYNDVVGSTRGGTGSFLYTAQDERKVSAAQRVTVSITPVNDPPVALPVQPFNGKERSAILIELRGTDVDQDFLSVCANNLPTKGDLYQVVGTSSSSFTQGAKLASSVSLTGGACFNLTNRVHATGSTDTVGYVYYKQTSDGFGPTYDTFDYTVFDGSLRSNVQKVVISVTNVNDPPIAIDANPKSTPEDTPMLITLSGSDPDNTDSELTYYISTGCKANTLFQADASGNKGAVIAPTAGNPVKVLNAKHQIYFAPLLNQNSNPYCTFSFYLQDPANARSGDKPISLIVTPVNDPPEATPTVIQTKENVSVIDTFTGTDIDSDINKLTSWVSVMPTRGSIYQYSASATNFKGAKIVGATAATPVQLTDSGRRIVFEPTPGEWGSGDKDGVKSYYTSFQFFVKDDGGLSSPAVVVPVGVIKVTIQGPTPTSSNFVTPEDTDLCFTLTATPDPDPGHDQITYKIISIPTASTGTLGLTASSVITAANVANGFPVPNGRLCYNPALNYNDEVGARAKSSVTFLYTATDDRKTSAPKLVTISVTPVNDPPVVNTPSPVSGNDTQLIPITLSASDVDIEKLTFCIRTMPTKGILYEDAAGLRVIQNSGTPCTTIPNTIWGGSIVSTVNLYYKAPIGSDGKPFDSFIFYATDAAKAVSTDARQDILIDRINRPPVAGAVGPITTNEDTPIAIQLIGSDPDHDDSNLLFLITAPCKAGTLFQYSNGGKGDEIKTDGKSTSTVTDPQRRIFFVPLPNENASPYCQFSFTVQDPPGLSSSKGVIINVLPVNDPPTATSLTSQTTEDTPVTIQLRGSDIDNPASDLTCHIVASPARGTLYQFVAGASDNKGAALSSASTSAPVAVTDSNCRVVFVPVGFGQGTQNGVTDYYTEFSYKVKDLTDFSASAQVFIGVSQINFPGPIPNLQGLSTPEDTALTFTLTATQDGSHPILRYILNSLPSACTGFISISGAKITSIPTGGLTVSNGQQLVFTPTPDYHDNDPCTTGCSPAIFTYSAADDKKTSAPFKVPIGVTSVNDAPIAVVPGVFKGADNSAIEIQLVARDVDADSLTFCINNKPLLGKLFADPARTQQIVLNSDCTPVPVTHKTCSEESIAKFYYSSPQGANGAPYETFTFQAADASQKTAQIPVQVHIERSNSPPQAADIPPVTTNEDTSVVITLAGADADQPADTLNYFVNTLCKTGTMFQYANGVRGAEIAPTTAPIKLLDTQRRILFVPLKDEFGSPYCSFGFSVADDAGATSSIKYITVNVLPVNDAPTAVNINAQTLQGTPVTIRLTGNDIENDALTCYLAVKPIKGDVYQYSENAAGHVGAIISSATVTNPVQSTDAQCRVVFVPNAGEYGSGTQQGVTDYYTTFQYVVKDSSLFSTAASVNIGVLRTVFEPPTPNTPTQITLEDTTKCFALTATVQDGLNNLTCRLVSLVPLVTGVLRNTQAGPAIAAPGILPSCNLCYSPSENYNDIEALTVGSAFFSYSVNDGRSESGAYRVNISVTPVNDKPIAVQPPALTAKPLQSVLVTLTGVDVDKENLTICLVQFPHKGYLYDIQPNNVEEGDIIEDVNRVKGCVPLTDTVWKQGSDRTSVSFYYSPDPRTSGTDNITFIVRDGAGAESDLQTQVFTINSNSSLPPPIPLAVTPNPVISQEDGNVIITLAGSDPVGGASSLRYYIGSLCRPDTLYQVTEDGKKGALIDSSFSLITNSRGNVMFVPRKDENGADYCSFGFFVQSNVSGLNSSESFVSVGVTAVNDAPQAIPAIVQTSRDGSSIAVLAGTDVDSPTLYSYIVGTPDKGILYQYDGTKPGNKGAQISTSASSSNPIFITDSSGRVVFVPTEGESGSGNRDGVVDYYTNFKFIVRDGLLNDTKALSSAIQTVPIGVSQINIPPVATLARVSVNENQNTSFVLSANDSSSSLVYSISSLPTRGRLYYTDTGALVVLGSGAGGTVVPAVIPGGRLTYIPPANQKSDGTPLNVFSSFTYIVSDGEYNVNQKVDLFVAGVNSKPVGTTPDVIVTKQGDNSNAIALTGTDTETEFEKLKFKITKLPAKGYLLQYDRSNVSVGTILKGVQVESNRFNPGPLFYVVNNSDASGLNYTSFEYVVIDEAGLESAPETVRIDISGVNSAPVAKVIGSTRGKQNTPLIICLGGDDADIVKKNDTLTAYITGLPENAKLYQVKDDLKTVDYDAPISRTVGQNQVIARRPKSDYAGCMAYVPLVGYSGENLDTIQFYVEDSTGLQSPKMTFDVDVDSTNVAPVATGVTGIVKSISGQPTIITLGATTSPGDALLTTITQFPASGTLKNLDGSIINATNPFVTDPSMKVIYTPAIDQTGASSFTYKVKSKISGLESGTSTVRINVASSSSNRLPEVKVGRPEWSVQGTGLVNRIAFFSVSAKDLDGDPTRVVFTGLPDVKNGVLSYNGKTITTGDIDPSCNCFVLEPDTRDVVYDGSTSLTTYNFFYKAANADGLDKTSFVVADGQIKSSADVAKYNPYTVALNASEAKSGNGPLITTGNTGNNGNNGNGNNGNNVGGTGNGGSGSENYYYYTGDSSSEGGLHFFWIIFICIVGCLCCGICIVLIVLVVLLVKKRSNRGYRRTKRVGKDQPYQNLGAYQPPNDGL